MEKRTRATVKQVRELEAQLAEERKLRAQAERELHNALLNENKAKADAERSQQVSNTASMANNHLRKDLDEAKTIIRQKEEMVRFLQQRVAEAQRAAGFAPGLGTRVSKEVSDLREERDVLAARVCAIDGELKRAKADLNLARSEQQALCVEGQRLRGKLAEAESNLSDILGNADTALGELRRESDEQKRLIREYQASSSAVSDQVEQTFGVRPMVSGDKDKVVRFIRRISAPAPTDAMAGVLHAALCESHELREENTKLKVKIAVLQEKADPMGTLSSARCLSEMARLDMSPTPPSPEPVFDMDKVRHCVVDNTMLARRVEDLERRATMHGQRLDCVEALAQAVDGDTCRITKALKNHCGIIVPDSNK